MGPVCPWRFLIVASDQPDRLPSPAFLKHHWIGVGTVVDVGADLVWTAPDSTPCRLHLSGRHWPTAVAPSPSRRGLVLSDTAVHVCRLPHHLTSSSDDDDDDNESTVAGAVVDQPVLRILRSSRRRWRCRSSSSACAGLGHGHPSSPDPLISLPGDARLHRLITAGTMGSAIVYSPAGNGKRTRIQRAAEAAARTHVVIRIPSLFSYRLADPMDVLESQVRSALRLRPVVVTLHALPFAFNDAALRARLRRLLRDPPDDVLFVVPAANRLPADIEVAVHDVVTLGMPDPAPILGVTTPHARPIADLIAIRRRSHCSPSLAAALAQAPPLALLDVSVTVPDVHWSDVGGLDDTITALQQLVQWPLERAAAFTTLGVVPLKACLLYGPPGTGKTLLAQAVATESRAGFVAVAIADLIRAEVGASEAFLHETFARARAAAPCVVFFDEIQAMFADRNAVQPEAPSLLAQFMTELDASPPGVVVLAATNRPDMIDTALLRPGRFDRVLFVPPPDLYGRSAILNALRCRTPFASGVDCAALALRTPGFTGADLQFLVQKAGLCALQRDSMSVELEPGDFEMALRCGCTASVTDEVMRALLDWAKSMPGSTSIMSSP